MLPTFQKSTFCKGKSIQKFIPRRPFYRATDETLKIRKSAGRFPRGGGGGGGGGLPHVVIRGCAIILGTF